MTNEISVTIDGKKVVVAEGTTILQAAKQVRWRRYSDRINVVMQ